MTEMMAMTSKISNDQNFYSLKIREKGYLIYSHVKMNTSFMII